jgi:hypothetical protein
MQWNMKARVSAILVAASVLCSTAALADEAPPERTGFQMAARTGAQLPLGTAYTEWTVPFQPSTSMSDVFSAQVPIHLEVGAKPIPQLFLGGYLGLAFGGAAGTTSNSCDSAGISCAAANFRVGVEIQYHILPAEKLNPWIGYGIGYESIALSGDAPNGNNLTLSLAGPEFAHFMGGLDIRLGRYVGLGPVVDFSIGRYTDRTIESGGATGSVRRDEDIPSGNRATHFWLFLGGRVVLFP